MIKWTKDDVIKRVYEAISSLNQTGQVTPEAPGRNENMIGKLLQGTNLNITGRPEEKSARTTIT